MREVILCEHAGMCFGANRAVETLENSIDGANTVYTFGPILHNASLVNAYKERGVRVIDDIESIDKLTPGKIVIRAHGVSKEIFQRLENSGFEVIDATCPFVKKIHKIVEKESEEGNQIVVIGDKNHPEVKAIVGWSKTPAIVVESKDDILALNINKTQRICIVSQTTFNRTKFQELVEIFEKNSYNNYVCNTICDATRIRQQEAENISKKVSAMLVIGDSQSSNSKKLFEICKSNCANTFFIQTVDDIRGRLTAISGLVGITAGASTPKYIIEEVSNYVRDDV